VAAHRFQLWSTIGVMLVLGGRARSADTPPQADDAISVLLTENEAAHARVAAISFSYEADVKSTPRDMNALAYTVVASVEEYDGCKFWTTTSTHRMRSSSGQPLPPRRVVTRMVLNQKFLAVSCVQPHQFINQYDVTSPFHLPENVADQVRDVGEDVLQYSFGTRQKLFRAIYEAQKTKGRWAVEKVTGGENGDPLLRVARYWTGAGAGKEWLMHAWDFDPTTGLAIHLRSYVGPGLLAEDCSVETAQAGKDTSIPVRIHYRQYRALSLRGKSASDEERRQVDLEEDIRLHDIAITRDGPSPSFGLDRLGAPDGASVLQEHLNATKTIEYVWGGVSVPETVHQEFVARTRRSPPVPDTGARGRLRAAAVCITAVVVLLGLVLYRHRRKRVITGA
jgi:hypothetical protein